MMKILNFSPYICIPCTHLINCSVSYFVDSFVVSFVVSFFFSSFVAFVQFNFIFNSHRTVVTKPSKAGAAPMLYSTSRLYKLLS